MKNLFDFFFFIESFYIYLKSNVQDQVEKGDKEEVEGEEEFIFSPVGILRLYQQLVDFAVPHKSHGLGVGHQVRPGGGGGDRIVVGVT